MICYTDASYNPQSKIAVIGMLYDDKIIMEQLNNVKNTTAEIRAVLLAIDYMKQFNHKNNPENLIIYTDCQTVVDLELRREKLENTCKQIYKDFFDAIDQINYTIEFRYIKGHKPSKDKNEFDKEFSKLDKAVRKQLRCLTKN